MPDVDEVSDEDDHPQEEVVKRANFRRIQDRRPEKALEQIHRDRNHYMKCFLNRMVEDRIARVRQETKADVDSEEEQERIAIMKEELRDDDPEHDMTAEDVCLFWGNVPDDVARFEFQLEKTERQAAEHRGRSSRRWRRGREHHQVASMRPQMAARGARRVQLDEEASPSPAHQQHGPNHLRALGATAVANRGKAS